MLGQFTRDQNMPECPYESSTKVADSIKVYWHEKGWVQNVTLDPKDKIWKEWWIGASGLHNACPRMYALMCAAGYAGELKAGLVPPGSLWNFAQGHMYHDLFQYRILPSFPGAMLLGKWERMVSGTGEGVRHTPSEGCSVRSKVMVKEETQFVNEVPDGVLLERGWGPKPPGDGWKYSEPKVRIPDLRAVIKLDGIVDWNQDGDLEIQEIKTEKESAREDLHPSFGGRPRQKHVEQVNLAMLGTGIDRARIIYVFKGADYLGGSTVEWIIPRDEAVIDQIKDRLKESVDTVRSLHEERDRIVPLVCEEMRPGEEVLPFVDLNGDLREEVGRRLKVVAQGIEKLPECKLKSKGRPKYCDGRDLCFGVRKRKKKI